MTRAEELDARRAVLIEGFRNGARLFHIGAFLDERPLKERGLDICRYSVEQIESDFPESRRVLEPLLDDPDPGVQVLAAGYLAQLFPERAIALLRHIDETCETEAGMTAFDFLEMHRQGMLELGTPEDEKPLEKWP